MPGIISAVSAVKQIIDAVSSADTTDPKKIGGAILNATTSNRAALLRTDGSITRLLSNYIVEPVIIATNGTRESAIMDRILEVNVDIFASFYLQAFEILRNMYGLENSLAVNILSTDTSILNRDLARNIGAGALKMMNSHEAFKDSLGELLSTESLCLSIEDDHSAKAAVYSRIGKDAQEQPLSTMLQRNLEITIQQHGTITSKSSERNGEKFSHTVIIPITIKAHVLFVTTDNLLTMLKPNSSDKTFGYRFDEYKAGVISLADLIFCGDLIKKYKESKLTDTAKLLELLNDRALSANSKVATTGMIGYEKYYNMLVITDEDKVKLDKHVNGNIVDDKYKEKLLEQARAMTCTIVDSSYERLYVLTKDIRGKTDISFKALSKRKDSGVDLSEMVRSLLSNRPPVF